MDKNTSCLPPYAELRATIDRSHEGHRWIMYRVGNSNAFAAWSETIGELAAREDLTLVVEKIDDVGYEQVTLMTAAEVRRRNEAILAYYEELLAHYKRVAAAPRDRRLTERDRQHVEAMAIEAVRHLEEETSRLRSDLT